MSQSHGAGRQSCGTDPTETSLGKSWRICGLLSGMIYRCTHCGPRATKSEVIWFATISAL